VLAGHSAAIGRDPAEIERSTALTRGRADDAASTADTLIELGVTLFTIGLSGPDYDLSSVPGWLAWRDRRNADRA
jgi:hypothetical protein